MDITKILELNEEKTRLLEACAVTGARHGLSDKAKNAALQRVAEINQEIRDIENPPVVIVDPLDEMTLEELRALYDQRRDEYLNYNKDEFAPGERPLMRSRDTRKEVELMKIDWRIQALEAQNKGGAAE